MKKILLALIVFTSNAFADVVIDGSSLMSAEKSIMQIQQEEPQNFQAFSNAYSKLLSIVDADKVSTYYVELDGMTAKQVVDKANSIIIKTKNEVADYIPKLELYKVTAIRNDRGNPSIDFKLKNTGNKALESVTVTFWFKDKDGVVIHEDNYYPVTKSKAPLKPNYIWKQSRGLSYGGHDVPSEWEEGSFDARVTSIKFLKDS